MNDMNDLHDLSDASQPGETVLLPLFPLRLVLFPGQLLPLHIFEPRYLMMVNQCVEKKQPFGIVLMRQDTPDWREYSGDVALPHDVGTTAHIRQVERLRDGRVNVITLGLHRFRIQQLYFDKPYLQGEVSGYPLAERPQQRLAHQGDAVRRLLKGYVELLSEVTQTDIDLDDIPQDARTLAFLTATVVQIPWEEKQELLAAPELAGLLESERLMLGREEMLLRFMHATQAQAEERATGPTGYLYPN